MRGMGCCDSCEPGSLCLGRAQTATQPTSGDVAPAPPAETPRQLLQPAAAARDGGAPGEAGRAQPALVAVAPPPPAEDPELPRVPARTLSPVHLYTHPEEGLFEPNDPTLEFSMADAM